MAFRFARFGIRSLRDGYLDFARQALRAEGLLVLFSLRDLFSRRPRVECNICGWKGPGFYPTAGPGYYEPATTCPGCRVEARHRSLLAILRSRTGFFEPGSRIIEVAPMRGFEELCKHQPELQYVSFDLERHAMERGDITNMRFHDGGTDYFVCFHVLEHIPDEFRALSEIRRVLREGGELIAQVPVDWGAEQTVEYGAPNPRDVGHVRRHGRDFADRIRRVGFQVRAVRASEVVSKSEFSRFGLSDEPIFLARKLP